MTPVFFSPPRLPPWLLPAAAVAFFGIVSVAAYRAGHDHAEAKGDAALASYKAEVAERDRAAAALSVQRAEERRFERVALQRRAALAEAEAERLEGLLKNNPLEVIHANPTPVDCPADPRLDTDGLRVRSLARAAARDSALRGLAPAVARAAEPRASADDDAGL